MRSREKLYERRLRRPIDADLREAIDSAYQRRKHEIPVATELHWHASKRIVIRFLQRRLNKWIQNSFFGIDVSKLARWRKGE